MLTLLNFTCINVNITCKARVSRKPSGSKIASAEQLPEVAPVPPSELTRVTSPKPELSRTERIFRDKVDKCSLSDVIDFTKQLNGRIENIGLKIPTEYDAAALTRPADATPIEKKAPPGINAAKVAVLVEKALGQTLLTRITEQPSDRQRGEVSQDVTDACQVWAAFCMHSAVKPCLFGYKSRSADEMQQIYKEMISNGTSYSLSMHGILIFHLPDKELTDYWFKLLNENFRLDIKGESDLQDQTYMNQEPEIIVEDMAQLALGSSGKDVGDSIMREKIYKQMHMRGRFYRPVSMPYVPHFVSIIAESQQEYQPMSTHWRGFLYEHDRQCSFFSTYEQFTADVLRYGLSVIFDLANEVPIYELVSQDELQNLCAEAVQAAVKTADSIKAGFFSANLELTLIKPQAPYDKNTMDFDGDEGDFVAGTLHLGLGVSSLNGSIDKAHLKPVVLLAS